MVLKDLNSLKQEEEKKARAPVASMAKKSKQLDSKMAPDIRYPSQLEVDSTPGLKPYHAATFTEPGSESPVIKPPQQEQHLEKFPGAGRQLGKHKYVKSKVVVVNPSNPSEKRHKSAPIKREVKHFPGAGKKIGRTDSPTKPRQASTKAPLKKPLPTITAKKKVLSKK